MPKKHIANTIRISGTSTCARERRLALANMLLISFFAALEQALDSLKMVKQSVSDGMPEDFYSIDLMNAYEQLGKILGEAVEDDLVNEIFSKFCMGK